MVSPAILITTGGILSAGLLNAYGTVTNRMTGLTHERLGILSGQDGQLLEAAALPAADHERLTEIDNEMPLVMRRIRRLRNAGILLYLGVGLVVLSVIAIAISVTSSSQAFGYVALSLVLAGTVAEFGGTTAAAVALLRSADAVSYEAMRTRRLGQQAQRPR
jgi:hypothetical protein